MDSKTIQSIPASAKNALNIKPSPVAKYIKQIFKSCLVFCVVAGISGITTVNAAPDKAWKAGQILVKPRAGLPTAEFEKILKRNNGQDYKAIGSLKVHIVKVNEHAEAAVATALSKNPHIEFAEMDMLVAAEEFIPDDPQFDSAWHLPKIQAPAAWDYSTAEGITIAILDTGVDGTHPDLAGNMISGWNAVDGSSDTSDIYGHGTKVAGTAAAVGNNTTGIASIAWNAQIMPVRISNSSTGSAYTSDAARGLSWAADNGADVANLSYAMLTSSAVSSAAEYMRSKGGVVVLAAGNFGIDENLTDNPHIITVSATDSSDAKASWSNYGDVIDVAAPGVSIYTTIRGGGYGGVSGTSFSSPATAGVVALIMAANPGLTPDEVEMVLEDSADEIAGSWHPYYGHGRINAAAAVQLAMTMETIPVDNEAPAVNIFSPVSGLEVSGITLVDVNASDNVAVSAVSLYADEQLVGTDNTSPYQFSWDSTTVNNGDITFTAYADDSSGNQGQSADILVTVANQEPVIEEPFVDETAPVVEISNPVDGDILSKVVSIKVSATDNTSISRLELYIDNELSSSVTDTATLSLSWNTRKVSDGIHSIEARAFDQAGNLNTQIIEVQVGEITIDTNTTDDIAKTRGNSGK